MAKNQRFGMTVSTEGGGREGSLGMWPDTLQAGPGQPQWVNQAFQEYRTVVNTARRYHETNRAILAKKTADLPDPVVRQKLAREDYKKLQQIKSRLGNIDREVFDKRLALRPYDYNHQDTVAAMQRQELRAHLRNMDEAKRKEALKKFAFRASALETEPELSGLTPTQAKALHDEIVAAKYPNEITAVQSAEEAMAIVETAMGTCEKAIAHELKNVGASPEEAPPPPPQKPWVA